MNPSYHRKSAPDVRGGAVQRKNRWAETPYYDITPQPRPVIDRQRPGRGCRHVLLQRDVCRFLDLLPDWGRLSVGLNAIILAPWEEHTLGWHRNGRVAVCAWKRDLVRVFGASLIADDRPIFDLIGVVPEPIADPTEKYGVGRFPYRCRFTEGTARAYQLLAVLLHELGHHEDRMATRARHSPCRGEGYAIDYANHVAREIWPRYLDAFEV
jgi:hypothetical protein